jgi:hypothetical protein
MANPCESVNGVGASAVSCSSANFAFAWSYASWASLGTSFVSISKNDVSAVPVYSGYAPTWPPLTALNAICSEPRFSCFLIL